jgi:DNA-binding transcriptional ArsR family regulator
MSDELARMLTNPLRALVLSEYQARPTSPSKVALRLDASVSLVSYHTDVLLRHSFIELVRTARRRGATEHFYRSILPPVIEDDDWARLPHSVRRALTLNSLGVVSDESRRAGRSGGFDEARAHLSCSLLELDEAGLAAVSDLLRRTLAEVGEIQAACRARTSADLEPYELVMLHFARGSAPKPPQRS